MHFIKVIFLMTINILYLTTAEIKTIYNVDYVIDEATKTIKIVSVDKQPSNIIIVTPNGHTNRHEQYDVMHHYPGVVSDVILPGVPNERSIMHVLLNDGTLVRAVGEHVYTNFHTHKERMIYGQLRTFALDDFSLADKIYLGAPVFVDKKLVSVITCRYDDYTNGLVMYPVTGTRSKGLISGQINYDDKVIVNVLRPSMSVYGRNQLPYSPDSINAVSIKRLAISVSNNRQIYRDLPRSVVVFHNENDIFINLVEGDFEIEKIRFDGPMVVPQSI
ncbi:p26-a [Apocheima cinerarium nucleopolyhedrovirus]|uniref:p26-a n=1 Tax=Apocheima cinerarium nucleopolyhedrovirus TaxID=307461 RepID=UPI0001D920CA|nr:p26-a [Apocheima cinerarium nucleopolyhedrovirus]ADB84463.1 p26-a [Apocheima cinerarium nucleopolyhedrovirus]